MKVKRTEEVDVQQFRVGDIIHFELSDGEKVEMLAVKEEDEGMIFCSSDCLEKECRMNRKNTNAGGWDASYLRKKLNGEILDRFPQEIREQMLPFENGDLLRLPTEKEIFGKNPYGDEESEDVTQWEPMKRRKNRMASQGLNSGLMWYWLKKPKRKTVDSFMGVNSHGNEAKSNGSLALGVRPVLKIKNPMPTPATQCPDYGGCCDYGRPCCDDCLCHGNSDHPGGCKEREGRGEK
nr:MAG TPA: hypothetical protein [Bacteriophage sp.]